MQKKTAFLISSIAVASALTIASLAIMLKTPKNIVLGSPNIAVDESKVGNISHSLITDADYYVSLDGDDSNNGSFDHPFKTIEKAKSAVAELDKSNKDKVVVAIKGGNYKTSGLYFGAQNDGTETCKVIYTSYGDSEVIINSGDNFKLSEFTPISDEKTKARLPIVSRDKVVELDFNKYGISESDYGKLYARGFYCSAPYYDGDYEGPMCGEIFDKSGKRLTLARYPNGNQTINTNDIVKSGKASFVPGQRNPDGDIYRFSPELIQRINTYNFDEAWIGGFKKYSWADESSPIESVDLQNNTMTTKFFGWYGADVHGEIFFYNVLEELDEPGEYFIDRTANKLYFYPEENSEEITLSIHQGCTVCLDNTTNIELSYLTIKGCRNKGLAVTGNKNTVKNVTVTSCGCSGLSVNGYDNIIDSSVVKYMGQGGIDVNGGDVLTLASSHNKVQNSLIHDIGQIYQTVFSGISINGVGSEILHNEIYNTSHLGISFSGNNNIVKYNYLHEVCTNSDDSGAIYGGRRWDCYGNVISNNCIYGIRNDRFSACGIYLDDGFSGVTVENNYLIDVGFFSLCIGGGRDHKINNNIIINVKGESINYDDRCRATILNDPEYTWFDHSLEGHDLWDTIYNSNYKSPEWQEQYPIYSRFSADFSNIDDPYFFPNPANSEVTGNMVFNKKGSIGNIALSVCTFSEVKDNEVRLLKKTKRFFKDTKSGNYEFKKDKLTDQYGSINDIGIKVN